MQGGADGLGAVGQHADLHRRRQHAFQARQLGLNAVDGLDNVGAGLARYDQVDPWCIAGPGLHVGVFRTVDDFGDITQLNRRAIFVGND